MKAVIFDVDGTLVNSVDLHASALEETFRRFGHTCPLDQIRGQIGKGMDQILPVFFLEEELKLRRKEIEEYRSRVYREKYLSQVTPFPEVRSLFEQLRGDGWRIALASSAKEEELTAYKRMVQIEDLLEAETSSDDVAQSKPHPDIFFAAMERLGQVHPNECVVVGDSPYDAEAAIKAGMRAVAFLCGGFSQEELRKAGFQEFYADAAFLLLNYKQSLFYRERPNQ